MHGVDLDSEASFRKIQNELEREYISNTFVTKTFNELGYHFYWFEDALENNESFDHVSITSTGDCKFRDQAVEFMSSGVKYPTLPPSQHREHPNFRYKAIGWTNLKSLTIMKANGLYDKLITQTFCDLLKLDKIKKAREFLRKHGELAYLDYENSNGKNHHRQQVKFNLQNVVLSEQEIYTVTLWLSQFYKPHNRYYLMLPLIGAGYYSFISIKSANDIVDSICSKTGDISGENKSKWHKLVVDTYAKGDFGDAITGYPTLKEEIKTIAGCNELEAENHVQALRSVLLGSSNCNGQSLTPEIKEESKPSFSDVLMLGRARANQNTSYRGTG